MTGIICEGVDWTRPDNPDRRCIRFGPKRPDCDPRCEEYQQPTGYVEASEWAEYMLQTHEQRQCPGCGLWTIWEPRAERESAVACGRPDDACGQHGGSAGCGGCRG